MNMTSLPERGPAGLDISQPAPLLDAHISVAAGRNWRDWTGMAAHDVRETTKLWRLVWTLAVLDIRLRYRGSVLGPFWLTLSTAVMISALGFLYAKLFHVDINTYLPFLSLSLVLWGFISNITAEGCTCFTTADSMIRSMRMPLSLHAARVVVRNVLVLGHNVVVIVVVFAILRKVPGIASPIIIPAFMLWLVDAFAVSLLLGVFCSRYRDVPPIVASIMQIAFFISPIIWDPAILVHRGLAVVLIKWNPFFALLEIVRGPLLNKPILFDTWAVALGYSAILWLLALWSFSRARARIAYWV